ncbi:10109_t:CDS:2, partial [Entrophospora sp. SA101]
MSSELELLRQRVTKLEAENTRLKQIIEEIANLRIENIRLKQIIKQNQTTNSVSQFSVSPTLSVTPQKPINDHFVDITNNALNSNVHQESSTLHSASHTYAKSKPLEDKETDDSWICSDSADPFEYDELDKNQIVEQDLKQELSTSPSSGKNMNYSHSVTAFGDNLLDDKKQDTQVTAQSIVRMFQKAIQSGCEEILHWYHYTERYDKRVNEVFSNGKVKIKTAKSMVYKEVKQLLPDITDTNLHQKTLRARKIYNLFNAIGIEKIEHVTYSAYAISNHTNAQIQNIINHVLSKTVSTLPVSQVSDTKVNDNIPPIPKPINKKTSLVTQQSTLSISNPPHDHTYFYNKTLEQYPNLYREFSSENANYYGITDETLCPLCKLNHEEGVEGRYETGAEPYNTETNSLNILFLLAIAEKNRWAMECFHDDLERDICFYQGAIERKENPRKYHKFLTDRDRLISEELLHHGILESHLSTAWLNDLMKEWGKKHTQF